MAVAVMEEEEKWEGPAAGSGEMGSAAVEAARGRCSCGAGGRACLPFAVEGGPSARGNPVQTPEDERPVFAFEFVG